MEKPFYQGSRLDYQEIIELLLRRYHSLEPFLSMSIREFAKFYEVAKDRELREMNYLAWCVQLPMMDSKSFISFEDYHRKMTGADVDMRPAEDIINEVEQIRREIYGNITV